MAVVTKYLHAHSDEYEKLWHVDASQQNVAAYWLYEVKVTLDVDMETGQAKITHVNDVPLTEPCRA